MNKFFLKIVICFSVVAGPINAALLVTQKAQELNANVVKAEAEHRALSLAEILMNTLGSLLENTDKLPENAIRPHARLLPTAILSLIGQYTISNDINGIELPLSHTVSALEFPMEDDGEAKESAAIQMSPTAITAPFPIPSNGDISLETIQNNRAAAQINVEAAQHERRQYYAHIEAKKREFCTNYQHLETQNALHTNAMAKNLIGALISFVVLCFAKKPPSNLTRYKPLEAYTALVGASKAIIASLFYQLYQGGINKIFCNSVGNYQNCIPKERLIRPFTMFCSYILLDFAHQYGSDIGIRIINLKKYDEKLRAHLADPEIDIDYDTVKNSLSWFIKTLLAGRLASTYV